MERFTRKPASPHSQPIPNIWLLQSRNDVDGLIAALHHSDPGTRRGAAAALRALGAWQAVPALQAALVLETDWQVHATISAALQYLDHDIHIEQLIKSRDVRGLTKMLNSARSEEIVTACQALGTIGDRTAVEPLVMAFKNSRLPNKVRLAAAEALLKLEGAPANVTLLGALRKDDWQVRRNSATVLGQLMAVWATDPLIKALSDPNPDVRKSAAIALKRFASPEALQAVAVYEEEQRRIEQAAAAAAAATAAAPPPSPNSPLVAAIPLTRNLPLPPTPEPVESPIPPSEPVVEDRALQAPVPQRDLRKKTGPLPPLPEPSQEHAKPMIKQLTETGQKRGSTGKLGALPETPPAPPRDALMDMYMADTKPSRVIRPDAPPFEDPPKQ